MARFSFLVVFFLGLCSALLFHLYDIQINQNEIFKAKAESQLQARLVEPVRGSVFITDKNGKERTIAINKEYPLIFASPKDVEDPASAASTLADVLNIDTEELAALLAKSKSEYAPLVYKASAEQVAEVKDLNITGLHIEDLQGRYYPMGNIASQVVGFVSSLHAGERPAGRYGIEQYYDVELGGTEGSVSGDNIIKSMPGDDVHLTLDWNIQNKATNLVTNLVKEYGASAGSFIVEDPKTGKILAMGATPDFDPNSYGQYNIKNFTNPLVQSVYEPGSVFKPLTMAAGIDSGSITPNTTFYDAGAVTINGRTIRNWDLKAHGTITMTNVIEQSVNLGTIFAEKTMGHDVFYRYLKKFLFDTPTGIGLPGEVSGNLGVLNTKDARDVSYATASYGQGIAVTPIRLISALAAIANGGVMMKPYVNAAEKPEVVSRVISKDTADKVIGMMVSAVDKAVIARVQNYSVAGKTGTAFVPDFTHGGYTDDVINTYIGFAPASDPQFIILIRMDKPQGAPLAGLTVVPTFRNLAEFILQYYNIPPDRPEGQ